MDRIEIRKRNMVPQSAMPYVTAIGQRYDSGDFPQVLDAALKNADWAGFPARRAAAEAKGRRRGIGLAYYLEATGGGPTERAEVRFAADGKVDVLVGTQSTGQGHETAYAMLTSHELGIPMDKIRIVQGDSDEIPTGGGTGGARSLYSEGQAILLTAATVIEKGKQAASEHLEAAVADIEFTPTAADSRSSAPIAASISWRWRRSSGSGRRRVSRRPCWTRPRWRRSSRTPSPMAATSPRSRSTPIPAWSRCRATWWWTMSGMPSTR